MAEQKISKPTKKEIQAAEDLWTNFVIGSKYTIYATILVLVGLAMAFVKF